MLHAYTCITDHMLQEDIEPETAILTAEQCSDWCQVWHDVPDYESGLNCDEGLEAD